VCSVPIVAVYLTIFYQLHMSRNRSLMKVIDCRLIVRGSILGFIEGSYGFDGTASGSSLLAKF
jgi:hypothetical protein